MPRLPHSRTALALALLLASFCLGTQPARAARELVGQPAPDFALRGLDGGAAERLSEHVGEVVLINFWATWCGPCRQEMPLLGELHAKYRRAGMVLLSVNVDDEPQAAVAMVQALRISYPVLFDARKQAVKSYTAGVMPLTVLVDRAGTVRYVSEGYKPGFEERHAQKVRELLNE